MASKMASKTGPLKPPLTAHFLIYKHSIYRRFLRRCRMGLNYSEIKHHSLPSLLLCLFTWGNQTYNYTGTDRELSLYVCKGACVHAAHTNIHSQASSMYMSESLNETAQQSR